MKQSLIFSEKVKKLRILDNKIKNVEEDLKKEEERAKDNSMDSYLKIMKEKRNKLNIIDEDVEKNISFFENISKNFEEISDQEKKFLYLKEMGISGDDIDKVKEKIKKF